MSRRENSSLTSNQPRRKWSHKPKPTDLDCQKNSIPCYKQEKEKAEKEFGTFKLQAPGKSGLNRQKKPEKEIQRLFTVEKTNIQKKQDVKP